MLYLLSALFAVCCGDGDGRGALLSLSCRGSLAVSVVMFVLWAVVLLRLWRWGGVVALVWIAVVLGLLLLFS